MTKPTQKNPKLRFKQPNGTEYPDWQSVRLEQVADIKMGTSPKSENYNSDKIGLPLFQGNADIENRKTSPKTWTTQYTQKCMAGDILMCVRAPVGDVAICTHNGIIGRGMCLLRSQNNSFLYQVLLNIENQWTRYAQGSTFESINSKDIKSFSVSIPTHKDEQAKIADFLSIIDKRIELLQAKYDNLQKYKTGILQKIFTQQIRFKQPNGKNYPDWQTLRLEQVADCLDNKRVPLSTQERNQRQGEYPYYGANGIVDYIDDYIFNQPLVLLAEDGGYFEQYQTRPIANLSYGKCWVNNHTHVLCAKKNMINEFLYYSLVHKNILGYVNVGTRSKLNKGDMLKIPVPVPHLDEQQKIADFLSAIDEKITKTKTKITATKSFKQGLLQKMFI